MSDRGSVIRTEIRGLDLCLDEATLLLSRSGEYLTAPIALSPADAERLAMEMAKAQLWEWNQIDELKRKADKRYKNYLGSWLVMCLAAFSAYVGFPGYYLPVFLLLISIFFGGEPALWSGRTSRRPTRNENSSFPTGVTFNTDWKSRTPAWWGILHSLRNKNARLDRGTSAVPPGLGLNSHSTQR